MTQRVECKGGRGEPELGQNLAQSVSRNANRDGGTLVIGEVPGLSRAELRDLQIQRLRTSLRSAHDHVPHYRHAFEQAGVGPDDLVSLADLSRFPFTTKADLR